MNVEFSGEVRPRDALESHLYEAGTGGHYYRTLDIFSVR